MTEWVRLRWERSYLVRETQVYEIEVPREMAEKFVNDPDIRDGDTYVTGNADPVDEYTDHIEDRDLTVQRRIVTGTEEE